MAVAALLAEQLGGEPKASSSSSHHQPSTQKFTQERDQSMSGATLQQGGISSGHGSNLPKHESAATSSPSAPGEGAWRNLADSKEDVAGTGIAQQKLTIGTLGAHSNSSLGGPSPAATLAVPIPDLAKLDGGSVRKPRRRPGQRSAHEVESSSSRSLERSTRRRDRRPEPVTEADVSRVLAALELGFEADDQVHEPTEEQYAELRRALREPYAPVPRSIPPQTMMVQTDSQGSMRIMMGRRAVPPGLAAVLGGDYNVNVFVPKSIDRVINSILMPDGKQPGLPPQAMRPGFHHDLHAHDQRVLAQLSKSPVAVGRCVHDPYTLQSIGGFVNKAALRVLFGEDSMLELVVTTMSSFPLTTPLYSFVESVRQLGGIASQRKSYGFETLYMRYEFASERDKMEVAEFCRLLEREVPPAVAVKLAPMKAAARLGESGGACGNGDDDDDDDDALLDAAAGLGSGADARVAAKSGGSSTAASLSAQSEGSGSGDGARHEGKR